MNDEIEEFLAGGETISTEFKSANLRPEALAREMTALSNSLGGTVFIGIEDDGSVTGIAGDRKWDEWFANIARNSVIPSIAPRVSFPLVRGVRICRVDIAKGRDKPYQTVADGKYWIRVGSTVRQATKEELSRLFQAAGLIHFDISPVPGSSPSDLSERRLGEYFRTVYNLDYSGADDAERGRMRRNSSLTAEVDGAETATVGGLLVFAEYPERFLPQAVITAAVFDGTVISDPVVQKKEIAGPLPDQADAALAFAALFVPEPLILDESARRKASSAVPREVLREALVNAVCHRDYSIGTRKTQLYVFKDRIELRNPGRIANTLTLEMIKYGNSAPRNIFLVKLMDNLRYIDGLGRGVPMIVRSMGGRAEFSEDGDVFRLVLRFS
jgi:ATP-dependent DNA helicase RecG